MRVVVHESKPLQHKWLFKTNLFRNFTEIVYVFRSTDFFLRNIWLIRAFFFIFICLRPDQAILNLIRRCPLYIRIIDIKLLSAGEYLELAVWKKKKISNNSEVAAIILVFNTVRRWSVWVVIQNTYIDIKRRLPVLFSASPRRTSQTIIRWIVTLKK